MSEPIRITDELKAAANAWINNQPEETCETCDGMGDFVCPECNGDGRVECDDCDGEGARKPTIKEYLRIQAIERQLLEKLRNKIPYTKEDWQTIEHLLASVVEKEKYTAKVIISINPTEQP